MDRVIVGEMLVPVERIELPTFGLQNRCSTAELNRPSRGSDSRVAAQGPSLSDGYPSGLAVLKAVFPVNRLAIGARKQAAFGLGQMEVDGSGLASGREQFLDVVHVGRGSMLFRQLLQRNQRRCQSFRDHPVVVAGDSLSRHGD